MFLVSYNKLCILYYVNNIIKLIVYLNENKDNVNQYFKIEFIIIYFRLQVRFKKKVFTFVIKIF